MFWTYRIDLVFLRIFRTRYLIDANVHICFSPFYPEVYPFFPHTNPDCTLGTGDCNMLLNVIHGRPTVAQFCCVRANDRTSALDQISEFGYFENIRWVRPTISLLALLDLTYTGARLEKLFSPKYGTNYRKDRHAHDFTVGS